jgi:hypothetical protein
MATHAGSAVGRREAATGILPPGFLPLALSLFLVGGLGPNIDLALFAIFVLVAGSALLWRPGEAPVLLFAFCLGWLGASIAVGQANWADQDVADQVPFASDMRTSIVLSLGGLLALAAGMRLGAGKRRSRDAIEARALTLSQPIGVWFRLYAVAAVVGFLASVAIWAIPGLSQIALGFTTIKWAFFFILAYACFVRGAGSNSLFILSFLFELVLGIGGFFSDFKTVFLVTLLAAITAGVRLSSKQITGIGLLAACLIAFVVVWSAIKGEYRRFLSEGSGQQIVTIDYATRMGKLFDLVVDLDQEGLARGANAMVSRLSYVEYFGAVLLYVPKIQPHANGAILADALVRPLTPRLLFPEKSVIDDSARSNLYTGGLAGSSVGTSISLGYVAECFIDFGLWGMFAALALIGFVYGSIYRLFVQWRAASSLLGMGIAVSILLTVGSLENSFTKIFGGVIAQLLVAWLVSAYMLPIYARWLTGRRA